MLLFYVRPLNGGARSTGCRTAAEGSGGGSVPSAGGGHRGSSRDNGIACSSGTTELGHEGTGVVRVRYVVERTDVLSPDRQSDRATARRLVQCQFTRGRDRETLFTVA
jgi:hypothetical protein